MKITLNPSQLPLPHPLTIFAVVPGTDRQSLRARIIQECWALWRLVSRSVTQGSIGIVELLPPRHLSCQKMLLPPESPMVCFFTSSGFLFKCHRLENSFLTILRCLKASSPQLLLLLTCTLFLFLLPGTITIRHTASARISSREIPHNSMKSESLI